MNLPPQRPADIMDIRTLCRSFPTLPDRPIERPHILDELEDFFNRGTGLITIEGDEGKGKTTLLAQFGMRHPTRSIGFFARPTSRHTYDPLYLLTDMCEQIHWLVYREQRPVTAHPPDDGEYRLLLNYLEGRARRESRLYYFLIDGLEEIPTEDAVVRSELLDLVPFGRSCFRFLYTGRPGALTRLPESVQRSFQPTSYQLTRFSLEDALRYLDGLGLNEGDVHQLLELTSGLPGHLTVIRQVLLDGLSVEQLMANPPKEISGLFDYQWEAVTSAVADGKDPLQQLLAIIAHDRGHHTLSSLARLATLSEKTVEHLLTPLSFVQLSQSGVARGDQNSPDGFDQSIGLKLGDEDGREVAFSSEAFRAYAVRRLAAFESWVRERVIDDLAERPFSIDALTRLPNSLAALGRHEALLSYLSADYFANLVERQRTLGVALAIASLGIRQAEAVRRDIELIQLSLTRGLLLDLGHGSVETEEVEAHMALGDEEKALALALSAPLAEDRLELLATIAKVRHLHGGKPSPEIQGQLEQLAALIDPTALGERVGDVAVSLLFSLPDVALRFLERARESGAGRVDNETSNRIRAQENDLNVLEWLDATGDALGDSQIEARETMELLQGAEADPLAKRLTSVMSVVYGKYSAEGALAAVAELDRLQDQLFVLREWLKRNSRRSDAGRVVDEALNRLLRNSNEEMPSAVAFRDIAAPLPWLSDLTEVARLVGRFDTFADLIERRGPSIDYVRLQLRLARSECRYDAEKANTRLLEIWYYADERSDLVDRAASIGYMVAELEPIAEAARNAGQREPMPTQDVVEINAALHQYIDQILNACADQYHATRGIISALALRYPEKALGIATRLNTRRRRLVATLDAVFPTLTGFRPDSAAEAAATLNKAMKTLAGTAQGDIALLCVAERISALAGIERVDALHEINTVSGESVEPTTQVSAKANVSGAMSALVHFLPAYDSCSNMTSGRRRVRALTLWEVALRRLAKRLNDESDITESLAGAQEGTNSAGLIPLSRLEALISQAVRGVDAAWDDINHGWAKVNLGFELAHLLASDHSERARVYLARAEGVRRDLRIGATKAAMPYSICIALAARSYAGLLEQELATDDDILRLRRAIDMLPSPGERTAFWADAAVRCFLRGRDSMGRQIVVDRIHPLLALVSGRDVELQRAVISGAAPALYLAHQESARDWIRRVEPPYRDTLYAQIAQMLIIQTPPGDPYSPGASAGRPLSLTEATDICRLIEDIKYDALLYGTVEALANCIVAGRANGKLSRELQRQIADRVRQAVERNLPDGNNIVHDGYKLIALAQVARMDPAAHNQGNIWRALATQARAIPNDSDRAFVLAHLAATTPTIADRHAWLHDAEETVASLPSRLSRIDDYTALAQLVLHANWGDAGATLARRLLNIGMDTAAEDRRDASTHSAQRRIIDLAYQFDESLARDLAHRIDDDPARLAHQLRALELKKSLADQALARSPATTEVKRSSTAENGERDRLRSWVEACSMHLGALNAGRVTALPIERMRQPLIEAAQLPLSEGFPIYVAYIENAVRRLGGGMAQARQTLRPLFEAILHVTELAPQLVEDAETKAVRAASAARRPADPYSGEQDSVLIRAGERDKAEQALRTWCASHPSSYLKLGDRFFSPEQLDWLRLLAEAMPPGCQISVLTSRKGQTTAHVERPWPQAYRLHWKLRVADQDPPAVEIAILGTVREGIAPFHDRRIVVAGAGLQLGTSFNALGGSSDTTISPLTLADSEETERDFDEWVRGGAWVYKGERLLRDIFRLDDPDE